MNKSEAFVYIISYFMMFIMFFLDRFGFGSNRFGFGIDFSLKFHLTILRRC